MMEWEYSAVVPPDRVSRLLAPSTIGTIANLVASQMEVACCHFQPCDDHSDFGRVAYCIRVSNELFDLFFNSPHGYRGAYFRSPGAGIDANRILIDTLTPKLLEVTGDGATPEEADRLRESLLSGSAKAWLAEHGKHICPKCEGEFGNGTGSSEILNGRWERGDSGNGRYAPRLTKIRVFGAFLDDRKNEFIPAPKRHRATEIHRCGWS
jgi:hypothetical protein